MPAGLCGLPHPETVSTLGIFEVDLGLVCSQDFCTYSLAELHRDTGLMVLDQNSRGRPNFSGILTTALATVATLLLPTMSPTCQVPVLVALHSGSLSMSLVYKWTA